VANKSDIPESAENIARMKAEPGAGVLSVSAVTGAGIKAFIARLIDEATALKRQLWVNRAWNLKRKIRN